jgi:hypothetical protein
MSLRQGAIASEQAINRLSDAGTGIPSEQGNNRENGKHRRSINNFNQVYLEDLVVVWKKLGRAAMEVAAKEDPTAFLRVATQPVT